MTAVFDSMIEHKMEVLGMQIRWHTHTHRHTHTQAAGLSMFDVYPLAPPAPRWPGG